ncbi:MAG: hypothetical protein IT561_17450 [Alphaproteobacteria bacterium]|nr:hypothetical protein [Alphaproteobacteria bacterium]
MLRDIALALCIYAYASQPLLAAILDQLTARQEVLCSYREDGSPVGDTRNLAGSGCAHATAMPAPLTPFRAPVVTRMPRGFTGGAQRFAAVQPGPASEERARAPPVCATSMERT